MKTTTVSLALFWLLGTTGPACAQGVGTIEGTIELSDTPTRKWASRYPGSGASTARLQTVPAVVWLVGDLLATADHQTVTIGQSGKLFEPAALAVRTGTVVRFPNNDPFYHNVYSYSGPRFDLGRYAPGDSREVTLDRAGVVEVYCEIHRVHARRHRGDRPWLRCGRVRCRSVPDHRGTAGALHADDIPPRPRNC